MIIRHAIMQLAERRLERGVKGNARKSTNLPAGTAKPINLTLAS
jgi:urease gamma subunit